MRTIEYIVREGYTSIRACDYLRGVLGYSSRTMTTLRKQMGLLTVNGIPQTVVMRVGAGDRLCINIPEDTMKSLPQESSQVEVAYEDDDVVVFNKPSGMPVHESKKHQEGTLANVFAAHCIQNGESLVFRAVNRLDRDTSGLVVVAKHQHSANALSGKVLKEYTAIACGEIQTEKGTVDAPIRRLAPERQIRIVSADGQHAVTHYKVLARGGGYTLLTLTLETGRTHQIRVHMASIGHPLAGDAMYGGSLADINRQALHCGRVEFTNEITNKCINIHADLCEDMQKLLQMVNKPVNDA